MIQSAGGPFKPGFGLSGAARTWTESSYSSFAFSCRLFRIDLYVAQAVAYVRAPHIPTLNFGKNAKFRMGHPLFGSAQGRFLKGPSPRLGLTNLEGREAAARVKWPLGDNMNRLRTCLAVVAAFVLGALLYRPLSVRGATGGVHVQAVKEGYNTGIQGEEIVDFACTQNACYLATR